MMKLGGMTWVGAATLIPLLSLGQATAQEAGNVVSGGALAQNVCSACHAVTKTATPSTNRAAPSFAKLARTRGMNAVALTVALQTSHRTMPNLVLTGTQRDDVIAYILSLKS